MQGFMDTVKGVAWNSSRALSNIKGRKSENDKIALVLITWKKGLQYFFSASAAGCTGRQRHRHACRASSNFCCFFTWSKKLVKFQFFTLKTSLTQLSNIWWMPDSVRNCFDKVMRMGSTTLQSMMNTKFSKQRFWHCYENLLINTIQTIPHNL